MISPYIVIAGHGRSGTNFLLRILDLSPLTHCRNEPNEIASSPFRSLPDGTWKVSDQHVLDARWDEVIHWTAQRIGEDEHRVTSAKRHVFGVARHLGLHRLLTDPDLRRIRARVMPIETAGEWVLPWWLGSRARLSEARLVLKLNQVPGWTCFLLRHRPESHILHIVRHPGGYLNSWRNRWVKFGEAADVEEKKAFVHTQNQRRLSRLRELEPYWSQCFGDIDSMSMEESELWYWRYATESVHSAGSGLKRYSLIKYEELSNQCEQLAETVYSACELPWEEGIADEVASMTSESSSIAGAWRSKMSESDNELLRRVLRGSPVEHWWDGL